MTSRGIVLLDLHRRVMKGDRTASAELFSAVHRPIVGVILKLHGGKGISADDAADLATDSVMEYLQRPEKFDPSRASLFTYLCMSAKGDALNLLRSRRGEREKLLRLVELAESERNIVDMDTCSLDADAIISRYAAELFDDEQDVQILKLMLAGERDTEVYAVALGLGQGTVEEKNAAVKHRRDRLEKRLRRLGGRV